MVKVDVVLQQMLKKNVYPFSPEGKGTNIYIQQQNMNN